MGHQVCPGTSGFFDSLDSRIRRRTIAARAQAPDTLHLFALQRFVNSLDGKRFLFVDLETVHSDHHSFQTVDGLLEVVSRVLNFLLDITLLDRP